MCKYCKLEEEGNNEYVTSQTIKTIKDGSQIFEAYIFRDKHEPSNTDSSVLGISLSYEDDNGCYTLKTKEIKIKYCPFCGEEL